jgi:hypothetical protein
MAWYDELASSMKGVFGGSDKRTKAPSAERMSEIREWNDRVKNLDRRPLTNDPNGPVMMKERGASPPQPRQQTPKISRGPRISH